MRSPNHSDLTKLRQAIDAKRLTFNRYDMRWSTESKVNWESFNLGIETALEQLGDLMHQLEHETEEHDFMQMSERSIVSQIK